MGLGSNFGGLGGGRNREDRYFISPKNRQREPRSDPGGWKLKKGPKEAGATTIENFTNKNSAIARGKELAKKNNTVLEVFDAAKKQSRPFNYK